MFSSQVVQVPSSCRPKAWQSQKCQHCYLLQFALLERFIHVKTAACAKCTTCTRVSAVWCNTSHFAPADAPNNSNHHHLQQPTPTLTTTTSIYATPVILQVYTTWQPGSLSCELPTSKKYGPGSGEDIKVGRTSLCSVRQCQAEIVIKRCWISGEQLGKLFKVQASKDNMVPTNKTEISFSS